MWTKKMKKRASIAALYLISLSQVDANNAILDALEGVVSEIGNDVKKSAEESLKNVEESLVKEATDTATSAATSLMDELKNTGTHLVQTAVETATTAVSDLTSGATSTTATDVVKKTYITVQDMLTMAQSITKELKGELSWRGIPLVMDKAATLVANATDLSKEAKKAAIIQVIDQVIDLTDTPCLPDKITDPIFKAMVPAFVDIFADDDVLSGLDFHMPSGVVSEADCLTLAHAIKARFSDGFQWSDVLFIFKVALQFANTLEHLDQNGKAECVENVVDAVIEMTDIPHLPNAFVHPIFKLFANGLIEAFKQYL